MIQRIREMEPSQRPRERLLEFGARSLSDAELLAVLIRTGRRGRNAVTEANALLADAGGIAGVARLDCQELAQRPGLGPAKVASLLQKFYNNSPVVMPASETLELITSEGARAFGLECGALTAGRWADIALLDLDTPQLTPHFHLASDLIYAANGSCIDTLICDGRVLMRGGRVAGEEEIIAKAREQAFDLIKRSAV